MKLAHLPGQFLVALVAVLALVVAIPAFAAEPVIRTVEIDNTELASGCDFPVQARLAATVMVSTHFDADGNVTMRIYRYINARFSFTNLLNGTTVTGVDGGITKIAVADDGAVSFQVSGNVSNITLPGQGIVLQDVGRLIIDAASGEVTFEAAQHDYTLSGEVTSLCAALA
jgi:hypothetical protein